MSATIPANFRVVYARPKFAQRGDTWSRVAKCPHTAAQLEAKADAGDKRVWRGISEGLSALAISPALEKKS
ncbi:hypothetical protein [Gluconacetobacter asukensis]|uniref:Uncharacterized protein n=1 Tax=Gluconacetobacter asukensis TaxID=1017181 RepID=A0A7W4J1C9_9PROT|nr:hypothetical protein [Gluconacetobacter asukensis]MBB2172851.1 hypothetical protein [Gluconacetobacter asukensis]